MARSCLRAILVTQASLSATLNELVYAHGVKCMRKNWLIIESTMVTRCRAKHGNSSSQSGRKRAPNGCDDRIDNISLHRLPAHSASAHTYDDQESSRELPTTFAKAILAWRFQLPPTFPVHQAAQAFRPNAGPCLCALEYFAPSPTPGSTRLPKI